MISYDFGPQQIARLHLNVLSVYLAANNLARYSARKGFQPHSDFSPIANYKLYAASRTVVVGLHLEW